MSPGSGPANWRRTHRTGKFSGFPEASGFPDAAGNPSKGFTLSNSSCATTYLNTVDKADVLLTLEDSDLGGPGLYTGPVEIDVTITSSIAIEM